MIEVTIFALTYVAISLQRIPGVPLTRPAASLLGAVAMVVLGGLPLEDAYAAVDMDVLVFLLGVMILAGYLEEARFFEWVAERVVERAGSRHRLLAGVILVAAGLSALFVNDTVCLVLTPLLLDVLRPIGLRPAPYLVALATASNTGSVLTVVGNPQNMLVAVRGGFDFLAFSVPMAPVALGALVLNWLVLALVFRSDLAGPLPAPVRGPPVPVDWPLAGRTLVVFVGALCGWLLGFSLPLVAIAAASLAIVVARRDPQAALARVEWPLLLFFAALFVLMRGLESTGATAALTRTAGDALGGTGLPRAGAVALIVGVLSNLVSNVPAVLLWAPVVPTLPEATEVWLLVAMSSTFAGNLLLVGSMANLIVAERAAARGVRLGFLEYAKAGVPLALASIAWGVLWLA